MTGIIILAIEILIAVLIIRAICKYQAKKSAEAFKYDFLYISYKGKMKATTDKKLGFISYGEDHVIYGHEILYFMRGVKKYSSFDTSEIMAKIYTKLVWLKANHPEIYQSRMGENFGLDKFVSEN